MSSYDDFARREERERKLWREHGSEMLALAPGDSPEGYAAGDLAQQRAAWRRARDRYRRVLSGSQSVASAMAELRRETTT